MRPVTANIAPPAPTPATPLLGSPELRVVAALLLGGAALLFALLLAIARWTDLLMLDLRQWRPSSSVRGLEGAALAAYFDGIQPTFLEQRPFRLTLQLPATSRVGDVIAAEGRIPRRRGRHCFFVLVSPRAAAAPETAATFASSARVWVDGRLAAFIRVAPTERARAISLAGFDAQPGGVRIRFEIIAEPTAPGVTVAPAVVHFEMATLRRCDS